MEEERTQGDGESRVGLGIIFEKGKIEENQREGHGETRRGRKNV